MRYISNFLITVIILVFCSEISAQENPFIEMANKPYADYCHKLAKTVYIGIEQNDLQWVEQTAAQMREAAKISKNKKWVLEADMLEMEYRFCIMKSQKPDKIDLDSFLFIHINNYQKIVQRAKKIKAVDIELRSMFSIWGYYTYSIQNYEMSFRYGLEFDKALSTVAAKEFPKKLLFYTEFARQYHYFREYDKAKLFFEKILEEPVIAHKEGLLVSTWNELGLIYRYHYNDLDKSDLYFRKILEVKIENPEQQSPTANKNTDFTLQDEYGLWTAIAKGNLGNNCYLRGDYDSAIPLLEYSVEKVAAYNTHNYPYTAGKAIILSEIFIIQSNFPKAKLYADKSFELLILQKKAYDLEGMTNNPDLWMRYYNLMSRYYRALGNNAQALLYADSAAAKRELFEDDFNLRILHRAEQHAKQEELDAEMLRSKTYYRTLIIISVFSFLLIVLLALLYYMYRQKRAAYRALVKKTQQWAQVPYIQINHELENDNNIIEKQEDEDNELQKENINAPPTETDKQLFDHLNKQMIEHKIYLNPDATLNQVAQQMNVNRMYLSQAVNRCAGVNFSAFINEFRVKEAVRLMSDIKKQNFSIEGIAFDAGFNDRKTFYRVFKKSTGFSPAIFRNNI